MNDDEGFYYQELNEYKAGKCLLCAYYFYKEEDEYYWVWRKES